MNRIASWMRLCGVIALPIIVVFIIVAAWITPGYSHISETISQLGTQGRPHPGVMNTGLIIYGLLINCFAYSLYRQLGGNAGVRAVWLSLWTHGSGVLLTGIFQDDWKAPGTMAILESALHSIFAKIAFLALVVAMLVFARVVYLNPAWRGFTQLSIVVAGLSLLMSLVFLTEVFEQAQGLLQRFSYAIALVWVEAVSLQSLRLSHSSTRIPASYEK